MSCETGARLCFYWGNLCLQLWLQAQVSLASQGERTCFVCRVISKSIMTIAIVTTNGLESIFEVMLSDKIRQPRAELGEIGNQEHTHDEGRIEHQARPGN